MKKLLAILGSITIMGSASSLVVACKSRSPENDRTGSVFVDNGVIGENGEIRIDALGLLRWYQKNIGLNRIDKVKQFNQLFAVGLMVEAANPSSEIFYGDNKLWKEPLTDTNQYGLENFPAKLKRLWGNETDIGNNSVRGAANNAFNAFEKEHAGKSAQANVVNEMAKQFPYVKRNYDSLKKAWINNYMLSDSENGALARLTKLLWGTASANIGTNTPDRNSLLQSFYRLWEGSTVATLESDINAAIANNWADNPEAKTNLINLINATGGTNPNITTTSPIKDWKLADITWANQDTAISPALVKDVLARLYTPNPDSGSKIEKQYEGNKDVNKHWKFANKKGDPLTDNDTYFDLVDSYPAADFNTATELLSSEEIFGFLTNSQRFGVDQYFINEKPVSLSEVVFKKNESGDLAVNINGQAFLNSTKADDSNWTQFYGLYNFLQNYVTGSAPGIQTQIGGISQYNFDTIFGNIGNRANVIKTNWPSSAASRNPNWDASFYELKNDDKLLTLSDTTHSNILRYSVYDFIQANSNTPLATYSLKTTPTTPGTIAESLVRDYKFDPTVANTIQASVTAITDSTLQTEVTNGLYATLNLIEMLNRKTTTTDEKSSSEDQANNKIYQVLNSQQGIIAFVDTDGLHITKINGYDILNNNGQKHPLKAQTTNILGATVDQRTSYINQADTFKRLTEYVNGDKSIGRYRYVYQDYDNQIYENTTPITDDFIKKIVNTTEIGKLPNQGVSYQQLNPAISNDYERFLVNNSILNSTNTTLTPFYKFNIFNEVKDYLTINDKDMKTLSPNNSWIVDYVGTVLGFDLTNNENFISQVLDRFMKFDDTVDSQEFKNWLSQSLVENIHHTKNLPQLEFRNNWAKWNEEINNSRVEDDETKNSNLPLMILDWGTNQSHIDRLLALSLFQPFATPTLIINRYEWRLANDWYQKIASFDYKNHSHTKKSLQVTTKGVK